jgi:hypothetical protein
LHFHLHVSGSFKNWFEPSEKSTSHTSHIAHGSPLQGTLLVAQVEVKDSQAVEHGHWNPPLSG